MTNTLAIVAGGGDFPDMVAKSAINRGQDIFAVRLTSHAESETLKNYAGIWAKPERLGDIFEALQERGIKDLVLIGTMRRPKLLSLRPDFKTFTVLFKILPALCFKGDDALLKSVRRMLEGEGFTLHGAYKFLDELLAPSGVLGRHAPSDEKTADINLGIETARQLGVRDAGQAAIIKNGIVLGQEDALGTDALIKRAGSENAVLVKTCKPQQDRALDMPTIGPNTVRLCAEKGMSGIAIEANATLIAHKKETIDLADAHGLFLVGIK